MKGLENRLVYLFSGELFSAAIFTFVYFFYFSLSYSYSLLYVLFILIFILLQGSFYWFIKWKRFKTKSKILPNLPKSLNKLKKINITLLCLTPIILIIDIILLERTSFLSFFLTGCVYIFAIIEYINYFNIQLTNYKNGRGKKSSIAKELAQNENKRLIHMMLTADIPSKQIYFSNYKLDSR